jgi:D-3-phosphoglycerate dehydrogenase
MTQAQNGRVWAGNALDQKALAALNDIASVTIGEGENGDWPADAAGSDAIIMTRGNTKVTGEVMDRLGEQLKAIARVGIGVDAIDLKAASERGIQVLNTPEGPTESTAEHAIALMLALCKNVMTGDRILRSGRQFPDLKELPQGLELAGATLGLVGIGRIGSRVAAIARVLGMKVLAYDPYIKPERAGELGVELVASLQELLPRANVLSIHSPATPETHHLINADALNRMQRGSYLINVARGALVDEQALVEALRSGHLAGAGLDVYDPEPARSDNPLFGLPNTICTPHIASFTTAGVLRMQVMACEEVASALKGEQPRNLVNKDVWEHRRR